VLVVDVLVVDVGLVVEVVEVAGLVVEVAGLVVEVVEDVLVVEVVLDEAVVPAADATDPWLTIIANVNPPHARAVASRIAGAARKLPARLPAPVRAPGPVLEETSPEANVDSFSAGTPVGRHAAPVTVPLRL
jgi:hypothetical protein